jgi:hypothetical protein
LKQALHPANFEMVWLNYTLEIIGTGNMEVMEESSDG